MLRGLIAILVLLLVGLQYRLWWGEGGRLELQRLEQQVSDYQRENELLKQRNDELANEVLDLKEGQAVLEQRAREELGLIAEEEVFFQFDESGERPAPRRTDAK